MIKGYISFIRVYAATAEINSLVNKGILMYSIGNINEVIEYQERALA